MIEQNDSGNGILTNTLTQSDAGRLIYGQLISGSDVDVFKFIPEINSTLEDGVGFTASIHITEDFSAQAGWKFSLIDSNEYVIATVDSANVADFASTGMLQLSGSYDTSKPLYVKVESSGSANHSTAQYELLVLEHNQINEDSNEGYASLRGDVASQGSFALIGSETNDTDQFVFETKAADTATTAQVIYIDAGATIDLDFSDTEGISILDAPGTVHGTEVEVTAATQAFSVEYGDVDSDTVTVTLRRADGSYIKDANGNDVIGLSIDLNSQLSIKLDPESSVTTNLKVTAKSSNAVDASIRTLGLDGAEVLSDGSPITSLNHGVAVGISLAGTATAYSINLTATNPADYSLQVEGLEARQNPVPVIQVRDYVSGDYRDGLPYDVVDSVPDYSDFPVILVDRASTLNLAEIFQIDASEFANIHFFTQDLTPLTGIGTSSSATTISAANYDVADTSQQLDLTQTFVGDEFRILSFASNVSLLANSSGTTHYNTEDQYNASGIIGAKIVISDQGITGVMAGTTIEEGESTTLTVSLSQALLSEGETIEVNLSNAGGDLLFNGATNQTITFDTTHQSIDVTVKAVTGDIDFASSENTSIQFTPVTTAYQNLLVADVALTVTEVTPSFSLNSDVISVINGSDYYQYTVTLDNATPFSVDNPVSIEVTAPSGFAVSSSTNIADALTAQVDLSADNASATWYVLADTAAIADADIPNQGLAGQIVHAITYGSRQLTGVDSLTVTRAVDADTSVVSLAGTSGNDTITASLALETITSLGGNDTLTYTATEELAGDSFNGGDGIDTLVLPGLLADYTAQTLINNSYRLTSASNEVIEISNVEQITFMGDMPTTIASSELNQAPTVQSGVVSTDGYTLLEATSATIDLSALFTDPEADNLYYTLTLDGGALPAWVQFNEETQALTLAPAASDPGVYTLAISATDNVIAADGDPSASFTVTVSDIPNVVNAVSDQTLAQDQSLTLDLSGTFNDADSGDSITVTATQADGAWPTWLTFDSENLTLSGTPGNDDLGSLDITLTATDTAANTISDIFKVTVNNVNDAPELIAALADASLVQNAEANIDLASSFTDVDVGDSLTYSATLADGSILPDWLNLNTTSGQLTAFPTVVDLVGVSITATAKDTFDAIGSDTFNLVVDSASVNVSGTIVDRSGNNMAAQATLKNSADDSQLSSVLASTAGTFGFDVDPGLDIDVSVYQAYSVSNNAVSVYDALDALKIAIGLNPSSGTVTGDQLIAADIDQDGSVTVYDALDILKAAIGITTNNPPEWVFVDAATDLSALSSKAVNYTEGGLFTDLNADISIDLTGILLGDVDASYTPDIV
jgi:hypothetical protein